jgi:hypothetical protein
MELGSGTVVGGGGVPHHVLELPGAVLREAGVPLLLNVALLDAQPLKAPWSWSVNWKPFRKLFAAVVFANVRKNPTDSPTSRPVLDGGGTAANP